MRMLTALLLLMICSGAAFSQSELESQLPVTKHPSTLPATKNYTSEQIDVKRFDQKAWRDIVEGRSYADSKTRSNKKNDRTSSEGGVEDGTGSGEGMGDRQLESDEDDGRYEYDQEGESISLPWLGPLAQIIFYGIIIAIIAMIIVQLVRNVSFGSNPKRTVAPETDIHEVHDITELDTDALIMKAHLAGDHKLAIRLYFLHLLKKLNENGVIVWTKDKTNRDYLSELISKEYLFEDVRRLTLAYERVWYGEHAPTQEKFLELQSDFHAVHQKFRGL